jgi:hypothetical protein
MSIDTLATLRASLAAYYPGPGTVSDETELQEPEIICSLDLFDSWK